MHERQEHDFTGTDLRNVIVRGAELRGGGFTRDLTALESRPA